MAQISQLENLNKHFPMCEYWQILSMPLPSVSGFLLLWLNSVTISNLWKEEFLSLNFHTTVLCQRQSGQAPAGKDWCRGHGAGCLPVCSTCLLQHQDHIPGSGTTQSELSPPLSIIIKKIYHRLAHGAVRWRHFLTWSFFSPNDSGKLP